jgi:acetyl-CoA carboxylase biotin carboxylase subunit
LQIDKMLEVAKASGCDAVHPGYGLLSENAEFARRVAEAGMTFIGPRPEVIAAMGSKTEARETMRKVGVPVVPGSEGKAADLEAARAIASELGYPVMLKASAGGGGIGMQAIEGPEELEKAWKMATARAKAYFGDDRMYVEKLILEPHHIEVQLLADHHGQVVHQQEFAGPVPLDRMEKLRCGRVGKLGDLRTAQTPVEKIRHHQEVIHHSKEARVGALKCK